MPSRDCQRHGDHARGSRGHPWGGVAAVSGWLGRIESPVSALTTSFAIAIASCAGLAAGRDQHLILARRLRSHRERFATAAKDLAEGKEFRVDIAVAPVDQHGRRLVATRLEVGLAVISAAFAWVLARGLAGEQTATYAAASAVVMLLVWVALPRQEGDMRG